VVAILEPKRGSATVEKIAVNAVMAGCLPQYLPVLIAAVQGLGKDQFNLYAVQGGTHNMSVLTVVNGPIARELDINCGYNFTGNRWRSSATICRALNFIITNIGGIPGATNINSQGRLAKFGHCIAENEDESPWEPLHVERGFKLDTSTVTVFAGASIPVDDNGGARSAKDVIGLFALAITYVGNRNTNGESEPLIIFVPHHAKMLANDGYTKQDVQRFIWERARLKFYDIPSGFREAFSSKWKKYYFDVSEDYGVPVSDRPEDISIVVMGGRGAHSLAISTLLGSRSVTTPIADNNKTRSPRLNSLNEVWDKP